jgi:fused signal recognition particle receptor
MLLGGPRVEDNKKGNLFSRLKNGLARTRDNFVRNLDTLLFKRGKLDEEFFEELEAILLQADVGTRLSVQLVYELREKVRKERIIEPEQIRELLKEKLVALLENVSQPLYEIENKPLVIMVVGVNGSGKTTTIGKLAHNYRSQGKKVVLAAADTFRAAAAEQLQVWGQRCGADIIAHQEGADPAAVAFDGLQASISRKADVLIVDTAGRLHTKVNLMNELGKIKRVLGRAMEGAPHEVLLVLDATTGQNGISQARIFSEAVDVTGVVLSKLDGTAKGGIVAAIVDELTIPIKLIGIGEGIDDLRPFDAMDFVNALFQV